MNEDQGTMIDVYPKTHYMGHVSFTGHGQIRALGHVTNMSIASYLINRNHLEVSPSYRLVDFPSQKPSSELGVPQKWPWNPPTMAMEPSIAIDQWAAALQALGIALFF